jgi:acetate kinase
VRTLVVNAGSRSLKLRVVEAEQAVLTSDLEPEVEGLTNGLREFAGRAGRVDAVGHRVVHGGPHFSRAVVIDDEVRATLATVSELAPLHNPPALAGIDACRQLLPGVPSVACFDTAFHAGLPAEASTYAIPADWTQRWGIRRYGFHGLSCAWCVLQTAELTGLPADRLRLVVCHLGGGASVTAISGGRSVDTTMGFTPLEGLVMATRCGDLDAGALLWVVQHGLTPDTALDDLEHRSGLLGLSGGRSTDPRDLLAARAGGDEQASLAISVYIHRLRAKIGAMAAATSGLDALVFTGGVGENSDTIRAETCAGLDWLGVGISDSANRADAGDRDISAAGARVRTLVVHAKEELQIASECERLLAGRPPRR